MQRFHLNAGWKRWVPTLVVVVGGTVLLPWQSKAQTQAPTQAHKEAKTGSIAPKKTESHPIQLGDYTLKLVLDRNQGRTIRPPMPGVLNMYHGSLIGTLEIIGSSNDGLILLRGAENLHGLDDSGRAIRCPDGTYYYALLGSPALDKGVWQEHFALETADGANSLKSLEGNILVDTGLERTFTFTAEEVRPDLSKKMGQVTVSVDSVKQAIEDTGDITMNVTYLFPHFNPPRKSLKYARQMLLSEQRIQVELVGTDGVTYRSDSQSEMIPGMPQKALLDGIDESAPSINIFTAHLSLKFQTVPRHVHLKSVVVHVFEQQGEMLSVPFKITDVPLPVPL